MKTAISLPDDLHARVERRRAALSMSRSEFYATAAAAYLMELESHDLTAQINEALALSGDDPDVRAEQKEITDYNARRLAELTDGDEW